MNERIMDHLPPLSNPHNVVEVPYLGGEYDGQEFEAFPARQHWDLERLKRGDYQGRSIAAVARFLQTWLYFGMLQTVLDIDIPTPDFVRVGDDGGRFITTRLLRTYLQNWKSQADREKASGEADLSDSRNQRALDCLAYAHRFWFGLDEEYRDRVVGCEIGLSIHVLASALEHALTSVFDIPVQLAPWRLTRSAFVTRRMVGCGWCPSVVEQICSKNFLVFQYYASLLRAPSDAKVHENCRAGDPGCVAKNVVDASYVTRHHEACCDCEFIGIDMDGLRNIVQRDQIPLFYLDVDGPNTELKMVAFEKGMQYTALSHVWSDGLGNPFNNSLPKCQLLHINKLLAALPQYTQILSSEDIPIDDRVWRGDLPYRRIEPTEAKKPEQPLYFWIDTLCVPLIPTIARKNAIKKMASTYSRATRVLVLDAELMQSTMESCPEERLARITCSTWIRRLWTLQEAALARTTLYQFAGEAVIVLDETSPPPGESYFARWFDNEVLYYSNLFQFNWWKDVHIRTGLSRIRFVFGALTARSTSHVRDEPICLAILLDLNLGELLEVPDADRMKKLWTMCHELPAATLFLPGQKMTDKNFGWAPASVINCSNIGMPMDLPATVSPEGLLVTLHGFRLCTAPPRTKAVIACDLEGTTYYIRQNLKMGNPSWEGLDLHTCTDLAVILGQNPMPDPTIRPPLVASLGALVKITKTEGAMLFAEYVRMVSVIGKDSRFDTNANPPWSEGELVEKSTVCQAEFTRADQRWCIGSLYSEKDG